MKATADAIDAGTDLSGSFTNDIDDDPRGASWDIGADEYVGTPLTAIYYSVGTDSTSLYGANASASSGTLTLASAAANNIGVGDEIREGSNRYYITGRNSDTEFTIQNSAATGTPGDTNITFSSTAITIYRAYNSLLAAFDSGTGVQDSSHLNTTDLVAGNFQLNIAGYNDGPDGSSGILIEEPWNTGPSNYIRVLTATDSTEVGASQRHTGVAGTGYRLAPTTAATAGFYNILEIANDNGNVRIEGLEFDGTGLTGGENLRAILIGDSTGLSDNVWISHSMIYSLTNSTLYDGDESDIEAIETQNTDNTKIFNNVIYNITNISTHSSSDVKGIELNDAGLTQYVYNNTIYDIQNTGSISYARGITDDGVGTTHAKNNYVGLIDSAGGTEAAFSGTFASEDYNVASDTTTTGPNSIDSQATYANYFVDSSAGNENLHLLDDSNALWTTYGEDLDSDPNLAVTDDIDGEARDTTQPDIGADEYVALPLTAIYYSVGTDNTALYSANASASSGTLTLAGAAANNIGVGDEIREGSNRYYIAGRNSSTEFTIQDSAANDGTPGNTSITFGSTAITIYRAFNSLTDAFAVSPGARDSNHLNTTDLVSGNFQLNIAGYNDGPDPSSYVRIDEPWVTGATNYIRVYSPTASSEVGVSQRHDGTAGSGYRIVPSGAATNAFYNFILVSTDTGYVRIEGLEIDGSNITDGENLRGLMANDSASSVDVRFTYNLVHDIANSTFDDSDNSRAIGIFIDNTTDTKVSNNIIYDITSVSTNANGGAFGIRSSTAGNTHYVYNNTVYNIQSSDSAEGALGIRDLSNNTIHAQNNYVGLVDGGVPFPEFAFSGTFLTEDYNVAFDGSTTGTNSINSQSTYASYFTDLTAGSEDLHLLDDSNGLWTTYGADLDADPNHPITDDIEGDARDATQPDVGADEYTAAAVSSNYRSIGTDTNPIYDVGNASINSGQTTVTFAGGASLPVSTAVGAVGQGDKLVIAAETFFILSRTDATHLEVQTAAASTHSIASYSITRAYNDIQSWEDPCGATPCLANSSGGRGGDLVSETRIEVSVAYKDGVLAPTAETLIQNSTTDNNYYMRLTVASGQRHDGTAGSGVIVDGGSIPALGGNLFHVRDPYFRMEWLEIRNYPGDAAVGNPINVNEGEAEGAYFSYLLIHDYTDNAGRGAINIYDDATVRNSIFYNGPTGIRTFGGDNPQVTLENLTIYNMSDDGVRASAAGTIYINNIISVGSGNEDFDLNDAGVVIDPSSGYNLYTDVRLGVHPGTNNQSPPASLEDLFVSIVVSSEDLHIESSGNDAIDNGTNLSGSFTDDIDEDSRPQGAAWDIGADEAVGAGEFASWNFDEGGAAQTAADSTGNGRDGTLGATTSVEASDPTWGCVTGGNALEFDGSDDQVLVGDHDLLSAISISAWINWDVVTTNDGIVSKRTATEVLGNWSLRLDSSGTGLLEWMVCTGDDASQKFYSTSAISTGAWTHLVLTFDETTNTAKFYINGTLDNTTTTFTNDLEDTAEPIVIGWAGQLSQFFDGRIDDVRIYDYALSQSEVTSLASPAVTECDVVLLVVPDAASLGAQDLARKALIETWDYTVSPISANDSQANFDAAVATSDAAYISEEITSGDLGSKLTDACIGVLDDEDALTDEFRISSTFANYSSADIDITDNSHYITSSFSTGLLTIASPAQPLHTASGTIAAGAQILAEEPATANGTLVVVEAGGTLTSLPGGTAADRRIYLPWGGSAFDINTLNANGQLLMRRSIEWAIAGTCVASANLDQIHYRWRNDDGGETGPSDTTEVSATGSTTTTLLSTYEALLGMSITPGAGDYLVWFSGTLRNSSTGTQYVSLFLDSSQIMHTERQMTTEVSIPNTRFVTAIHAYISGVADGEAINVQWHTSAGTATMLERTLTVTKVDPADIWQETRTNALSVTPATDTLIDGMTITPGAGDYLVWFSGSNANTLDPTKNHVSLYMNNSQVVGTEREIDQEESLGNTYFPVATHARVISVGAGEAIEARWRRDSGNALMNARALTVYKINPADSQQAQSDTDTAPFSTGTYTQVNSMTLTPGEGDWLVWFSSSMVPNGTGGDTYHVALFSGGSIVPESEREIWVEGSIDISPYQSYPVATHAYITGLGATDDVEVRWVRTSGSGNATMHERTLVVQQVAGRFAAAEDTALSNLATLTPRRLRLEVSNEGTGSSGSVSYQLEVAETATCSGGSYSAVPTGSAAHWQIIGSVYISDGEATSNIVPGLADEASTFVPGELKDTGNATSGITLASDEFTEIEFAIQATTNATAGGDYCFRLYDSTGASVLDTYDVYAEASVAP